MVGVSASTTVEGSDEEIVLETVERLLVEFLLCELLPRRGADPDWRREWCSVEEGAWLEGSGSCGAVEGFVRLGSSCPCDVGPLVVSRDLESTGSDATPGDDSGVDCVTPSGVLVATIEWKIFGFELGE